MNLPVTPLTEAHGSADTETPTTPKLRILIVDDDFADRTLVRTLTDKTTYSVIEAETGKESLEIARDEHIDCALVDYNLPDLMGIELLEQLREATDDPHLPIILCTGQGDETLAARAIQDGASDYLPKSRMSAPSLSRVLGNAISQSSLSRSLAQERQRILQMNEDLIRANREISTIYQTVSHELKTPLMAIREYTSLTLDEVGGPISEQQKELLSASLRCCDRLTTMINDLLDTARIETGKLSLQWEDCDFNQLIEDSINSLTASAEDASITLEKHLEPNLHPIQGDQVRLVQVVNNLITNAIKFTEPGGKITVSSENISETEISVRVRDTGRGIEEKFHNSIFERFEQTRSEDADLHKGMGIGLYLCANIMESHKGSITLESTVGEGSTFILTLPTQATTSKK